MWGTVTAVNGPVVVALILLSLPASWSGPVAPGSRDSARRSDASRSQQVSILVYHRFAATAQNSMTIRTSTFAWQVQYLLEHHYTVVPLRALVAYRLHRGPPLPSGAIILTADDGHRSVFTEMLPLVRNHRVPVTLFIYPSAISKASYAMTWAELGRLHQTGLFDIQSHTYWHPNFTIEKQRLTPEAYREFVTTQLCKPRTILNARLGIDADLLAWPFGLYNDELMDVARRCGYVAGVTLDRHLVRADDDTLTLPRFLVTDDATGKAFARLLPPEPIP